MAMHHASSGELVDLRPLQGPLDDSQSTTLLRDPQLKVMRLVLPAGKQLPEHAVEGPLTMHCLQGAIDVTAHGTESMRAGDLLYLEGAASHRLEAREDSTILVTMVVQKPLE